jgi:erythromycin esterase-like protein
MADTLQALATDLTERGSAARVAVWAHSAHVGDARATEPGWRGELNLGQLARERYGRGAILIGFTTCTGTVTATRAWDAPGETMRVASALAGSHEALFHAAGTACFLLDLRREALALLREPRLERAIGLVYRCESERISHHFQAALKDQFDLVVHVDETSALRPLDD